jgi:hypothetical protein
MTKLFFSLATLALLGTLFLTQFRSSASQDGKEQIEETATLIGEKTHKEKIKGRLFAEHKTGRKIPELTESGSGEVVLKSIVYPPFIKGVSRCAGFPSQRLTSYGAQADAVIIGSILGKSYSQLTEGDDFIFSEYIIAVEEVIKNNRQDPIEPNSRVSIVRPGGRVKVNNRDVSAVAGSFLPFELNSRYLFFLKSVPETGDYRAFGSGTFLLRDNRVFGSSKNGQAFGDVSGFIAEVRSAISATPCAHHSLF